MRISNIKRMSTKRRVFHSNTSVVSLNNVFHLNYQGIVFVLDVIFLFVFNILLCRFHYYRSLWVIGRYGDTQKREISLEIHVKLDIGTKVKVKLTFPGDILFLNLMVFALSINKVTLCSKEYCIFLQRH